MKCQILFSLRNKINSRISSATKLLSALRVKQMKTNFSKGHFNLFFFFLIF